MNITLAEKLHRLCIPPRTYLWLDEYWQCTRRGHLFWHGTHWQRITERLRKGD